MMNTARAFTFDGVCGISVEMQNFRNLVVWRRSMDLATMCYKLTADFPPSEQYGLKSQLRRAAVSIPSNIAEGCGRGTPKDFARFLRISYASSCEVETQLEIATKVGFGDPSLLKHATLVVREIQRMLAVLLTKLDTSSGIRN